MVKGPRDDDWFSGKGPSAVRGRRNGRSSDLLENKCHEGCGDSVFLGMPATRPEEKEDNFKC